MKALTVRQPWASLIMAGVKDVECRSWNTSYRGELVIHAGLATDRDAAAFVLSIGAELPEDLPAGAILGTVRLVDVVTDSDSPWAEAGKFHWILADPEPWTEPVPAKGRLGLWNCDVTAPAVTIADDPIPDDLIADDILHAHYTTVGPAYIDGEHFTICLGPEPDGRISLDVQTGAEDGHGCRDGKTISFELTADQVDQLAVALVRVADQTSRLTALARDLDRAADDLDSVPAGRYPRL